MTAERFLIVNADDFGRSRSVNAGVTEAHEQGIVTSASLLVLWPGAEEAADFCRKSPALAAGLHFDLGEWVYVEDEWRELYRRAEGEDRATVAREAARQLELFRRLVGREPTHLDSHQHVHQKEPARGVLRELAERISIPLRGFSPSIRFCGDFYGQNARGVSYPEGISVERLVGMLRELPVGVTELGCHPGYRDERETAYADERWQELKVLCDPRVRQVIREEGISLTSFAALGASHRVLNFDVSAD